MGLSELFRNAAADVSAAGSAAGQSPGLTAEGAGRGLHVTDRVGRCGVCVTDSRGTVAREFAVP